MHNVRYTEYGAHGDAFYQAILPIRSDPPARQLPTGHYWVRNLDTYNAEDHHHAGDK